MDLFGDYKKNVPKNDKIHNFQERDIDEELLELWGRTASNTENEYKAILQANIDNGVMSKDRANKLFLDFRKARETFGIPCNIRRKMEVKQ